MSKSPAAFSLIELLVVIAILGLLTFVAIPSIRSAFVENGAITCGNNLRLIQAAKESYYADNPEADTAQELTGEQLTNYLNPVPVCPRGGTYEYHRRGELPTCNMEFSSEKRRPGVWQDGQHNARPLNLSRQRN